MTMNIIVIPTPPDEKNSEYSAHLIEHEKLSLFHENADIFLWNNIRGHIYTTHTEYHFPADNPTLQKDFIEHLLSPLNKNVTQKEKIRLREEVKMQGFYQKAIEHFGKKYFDEKYSYGKSHNISFEKIQKYHAKNYFRKNILILDKNTKFWNEKLHIFPKIKTSHEKIGRYQFVSILANPSPENLYIFELLEKFLDIIVARNQIHYIPRDIVIGHTQNLLWIIIENDMIPWIQNIGNPDILAFVSSEKNLSNNNFLDADIASICFFQKILSGEQKDKILASFLEIFYHIFKEILSKKD